MKIYLFLFFLLITRMSFSQVNWAFNAKKIDAKKWELHLVATVSSPWHIYSMFTPSGGPLPTKIAFTKNALVNPEGTVTEKGKLITRHEEVFGVDVKYYDNTVDFVQVVTLKAPVKTALSGTVTYMVCNDTQCLPPKDIAFSIPLK